MIMAKRWGEPDFRYRSLKPVVNFWVTDNGEIVNCRDHEEGAKQYVAEHNMLLDVIDWMQKTTYTYRDYRSFVLFNKGWIRATGGRFSEDGYGITVGDKVNGEALNKFIQYMTAVHTHYIVVDRCYEDDSPETSKTFNGYELDSVKQYVLS